VGPSQCPFSRHSDHHPAEARTPDRQAAVGVLAAPDEAAVCSVQAQIWATMASGDCQLHAQAAVGRCSSRAVLQEPMPRDHLESHNT
jgi:hypothetical protein